MYNNAGVCTYIPHTSTHAVVDPVTNMLQVLSGFEYSLSSNGAKDKAADLVLLEADLALQHPALPGLVRMCLDVCVGGGGDGGRMLKSEAQRVVQEGDDVC